MHVCLLITSLKQKMMRGLTRLWFWSAASMGGMHLVDLSANALTTPAKVNVHDNNSELKQVHSKIQT